MFGSNAPGLRFPKPVAKITEARQKERDRHREWTAAKKAVTARDKGLCRCCGKPGVHVHHLIYRSHGGTKSIDNLVLLCVACHQDIHAKLIRVEWGGKVPAQAVRFTRPT